jgi:hypothetical protein
MDLLSDAKDKTKIVEDKLFELRFDRIAFNFVQKKKLHLFTDIIVFTQPT